MSFNYSSFKAIGIYTVAGFLNKGIAFLFLPLLTAYLQPSDYGIITLFSNVILLITPFIGLSVITSISTDFFKYDKTSFATYFSSILLLPLLLSLVFFILIFFLGKTIAGYAGVPVGYIYALPLLVLSGIIFEVLLTIIRNRNEPLFFALLSVIKTVFELGGSVFLIAVINMGWQGRILGWLITGILSILYAIYFFYQKKYLTKKIDKNYFPDELKYSIPIIINQFAIFSIMSSDKFFILENLSTEEVGIYGVACQIGFVAFAISGAMIMYFNPYLYKALSEFNAEKKKEVIGRIIKFIGLMLLVCIAIAIATPFAYKFFINATYHAGMPYVKWILLGYFFWFIYWILLGFLYFFKMKRVLLLMSAFSMLLALGLNFILIQKFGTIGAVYSLNINCFISMAILVILLRYKFRFI